MYPEPWGELSGFLAHDWMRHRGERTLEEVATSACDAFDIQDGDSLVGTSLGGMVACEITRLRRISSVFLVGSAVNKKEISGLLEFLHPCMRMVPLGFLHTMAGRIPSELCHMFAHNDPEFIRSMSAAVFEWRGLNSTSTRIYRLHGKRDRIIPAPQNVDLLLDGGHLISMTHPRECVEFLRYRLSV
jgi:pimeloyl-ACP methyl ester carboxylesterase